MSIIVQKYGGTSVATPERIRCVAQRVIATKRAGHQVVVVVSAMATETDRLLQLAKAVASGGHPSEVDVVASTGEMVAAALTALALQAAGEKARSLLGFQLPILTDTSYAGARILSVNSAPILACFESGVIPVIAGFQGVDEKGQITTLGRGGSDTTAVAIAASLGGASCEIYTDVDGVYSADPRICPKAVLLPEVSYRFMREAAGLGTKVMHDRSVSMGMRYQVPITVRNSFNDSHGTAIGNKETSVSCIALDSNIARVSFFGSERIALIPKSSISGLADDYKQQILFVDDEVAKVSVVGGPLTINPAYHLPTMVGNLNDHDVPCLATSAGPLSLSFLVPKTSATDAVQLLHSLSHSHQEAI